TAGGGRATTTSRAAGDAGATTIANRAAGTATTTRCASAIRTRAEAPAASVMTMAATATTIPEAATATGSETTFGGLDRLLPDDRAPPEAAGHARRLFASACRALLDSATRLC